MRTVPASESMNLHVRSVNAFVLLIAAVLMLTGCGGKKVAPAKPQQSTGETPAEKKIAGFGSIVGIVTFQGSPRKPRTVTIGATDPACMAANTGPYYDEKFVFTNSADGSITVRNVFVYIEGDPPGEHAVPTNSVVIDQKGCRYIPHVLGMMAGQELLIKNSDSTVHNVNAMPRKNRPFNNGQTQGAPALSETFANEEVMVRIKCDMHPWMTCYVGVLTHPYFDVTGIDGRYAIERVPVGEYNLVAWQEALPSKSKTITVEKDQTTRVEFVLER